MITTKGKFLQIGDEFTTMADQGEVWYKVLALEPNRTSRGLIDLQGEVVQANPGLNVVGGEKSWMDVGADEEVIVR